VVVVIVALGAGVQITTPEGTYGVRCTHETLLDVPAENVESPETAATEIPIRYEAKEVVERVVRHIEEPAPLPPPPPPAPARVAVRMPPRRASGSGGGGTDAVSIVSEVRRADATAPRVTPAPRIRTEEVVVARVIQEPLLDWDRLHGICE
jgi:hypothetical protein